MKGIVLVTGDEPFRQQVQAECTRLDLDFATDMPVERMPGWALVADFGLLSPLAAALPNQDSAVEDPAQALDVLRDVQPDIAILDLYMPLCSGTELAQIIRQIPQFDSLPIVFLSSESELAAQMNAVSIGGDNFVAKGTPAALMNPLIHSRAARMRALRRHLVKESP
ncbi:MAG: response regulator [Rhodospirillaceae bacterium]|nr:response regulator [Rhodospirillales bacterium]